VACGHGAEVLGGWEMKAYALLHSRFREILLLDADNVPIVDPEFLFDCEEFRRTGTVFWPDLVRIRRDSPIWAMCGVPYRDTPSVESGQLLIDKQRAWPGLVLANWMNQHSDAFYDIVHGDKDTFLLAWLAQGTDFAMVQRLPRQLPHVLCQRGFDGTVLFQHRGGAKWILLGRNPKIEGFAYERECFDLLRELGQQWDGCIFLPPPRSERAHEVERALASQRAFRFERVSADVRAIELLPDHRIGPAPDGDGIYWHVEEGTEGLALVFTAGGRVSCRMEPSRDGGWQGRLVSGLECPVSLVPEPSPTEAGGATPPRDAECLQPGLLAAVLDQQASLPNDAEATRDFIGLVRCLGGSHGESALRQIRELADRAAQEPPDGVRRRLLSLALGELTPVVEAAGGSLRPGHGSRSATDRVLRRHYER
jgi:hypothetical protein